MATESCLIGLIILISFTKRINSFNFISNLANTSDYGPYNQKYTATEICHGPKSSDVASYTLSLQQTQSNSYIGHFNVTVLSAARLTEVKITVYIIKKSHKKEIWSYRINRPCQHLVVGYFFQQHFNFTRCIVQKGNYTFNTNFSDLTKMMLGDSFFYGEFLFKVHVTATTGNMCCLLLNTVFSKRIV